MFNAKEAERKNQLGLYYIVKLVFLRTTPTIICGTRMHSSRMRTVRSSSRLLTGGSPPGADPPAARHAEVPPAMHAGI